LIFVQENLNVSLIHHPNPDADTGGSLWVIISGKRVPPRFRILKVRAAMRPVIVQKMNSSGE